MPDPGLIDDVRAAKAWVHDHADAFASLQQHLAAVETAYLARTVDYAALAQHRPQSVSNAIESAATEPGRAFPGEYP